MEKNWNSLHMKVQVFWKDHKNLKLPSSKFWHWHCIINLYYHGIHYEPISLTIVLVTSNLSGRWLQIFVAFLENLNFSKKNHNHLLEGIPPMTFFHPAIGNKAEEISALCLSDKFRISSDFSVIFFLFLYWKIENNQFSIIRCCFLGETNLFSSKQSLINDGCKNTICELTFFASWKFLLSYPPEVMI